MLCAGGFDGKRSAMFFCSRHTQLAFCSFIAIGCLYTKPSHGYNDEARLQIGIKHRPALCSRRAQPGDEVSVHYKGWIDDEDSVVFKTTEGIDPLTFVLGEGEVIEGWEKGLMGMCVGERRKLKVPHSLGYKDIGHPGFGIPGGANLIFEVEAAAIEDGPTIIHLDADSMQVYSEADNFLEL